jgi:hypothetical protein
MPARAAVLDLRQLEADADGQPESIEQHRPAIFSLRD